MMDWTVTDGRAEPLGAVADEAGVNFAVFSAHAESISVCLFDPADTEVARLRLPGRTGDVFHGHVMGLQPGARYGLRAHGPWDPAHGHRFNAAKLLVDPYATALDRPFRLTPDLCDIDGPKPIDTAPLVPRAIVPPGDRPGTSSADPAPPHDTAATRLEPHAGASDPAEARPALAVALNRPAFDWGRQVIYELHVRGFTARHPALPPEQRGTFAGLAHPAVIAYLKDLGVTTIELMPSAAWIDDRHLPALGAANYWGYNPIAFLTPDPRLAPGGWQDVRAAVATLQAAGFAVLLDVVLNHSGEGDHLGPTLSLRGLDNATYYRTKGDRFVNDAGCGNVLALDRPPVVRLAMDALRTWALRGGLDGFRLDLAATLGRREDGFDPTAPLLTAMQQDPVLSQRVIVAEPWDVGAGGYRLGAFPAGWGEWNDRFRDTVRRFWRGDAGMLGDLATRIAGSADIFAPRHRPPSRSINYVTAHDGFTLADLVAYTVKRNDANMEGNRDGSDDNYSWNNGHEGPTADPAIQAARRRDARALLATLLFARGTPMLSMGDEAGRSQGGNNNAYTQDNPTSWFDWAGNDTALTTFATRLIRARLDSPVLCDDRMLTGRPTDDSLIPDVAWHLPDGRDLAPEDWHRDGNRTLIVTLYSAGQRVVVVLHAGYGPSDVVLPEPCPGRRWVCSIDSAEPERNDRVTDPFRVAPRSVVLLTEEPDEAPRRRTGVTGAELDRLARAAGIAPVWWDIGGGEHRIGDDTKQVLLSAMRLPARTPTDLRDSLARLTARGLLPPSFVVRDGIPIVVPLNRPARGGAATVGRDDGSVERFVIPAGSVHIPLTPQPAGRHLLRMDDAVCHLIVVPARCYLPPALMAQRRFGIAAQLYSLRRSGDQGIGDFTTLGILVQEAAAFGASAIGLNPLHALFPGDRERASPYYPSDRRFLDPIYLDVADAGPVSDRPMNDEPGVDYPGVWAAKQRLLRDAYSASPAHDPAFETFIADGGIALHRFATFEVIAAHQDNGDWRSWPAGLRHPQASAVTDFAASHAEAVRFACWLQYCCDQQFSAAAKRADLTVGLYRDLAVGSAPDGAEAWSRQDVLLSGVSIGAPPDPFSPSGQVWGLPAPDPLAMTREGYIGFSELLACNMRHAGALRIDHAMGLQRLFLVPDGASAADGAYLAYPFRDLLGVLALESQRAKCLVVGEALGTVPEGMTEALADANVLSYSVLWFERDAHGLRRPAEWRAQAAACVSTHDLPTLAGWWQGADIAERDTLGLLDDTAEARAVADRASDKARLLTLLMEAGLLHEPVDPAAPMTAELVAAVHEFVAASPAVLTLIQADDMTGEVSAVNLPGTDRERPNWRRRLRIDTTMLCRTSLARMLLRAMRKTGRV
jgi:glycogen operon protein